MIELCDKDTGKSLGMITEAQFQFLADRLEEESDTDTDYYLNRDTLERLVEQGIDGPLLDLLLAAFGDREEMEIKWLTK
jgi:hypothetical protein